MEKIRGGAAVSMSPRARAGFVATVLAGTSCALWLAACGSDEPASSPGGNSADGSVLGGDAGVLDGDGGGDAASTQNQDAALGDADASRADASRADADAGSRPDAHGSGACLDGGVLVPCSPSHRSDAGSDAGAGADADGGPSRRDAGSAHHADAGTNQPPSRGDGCVGEQGVRWETVDTTIGVDLTGVSASDGRAWISALPGIFSSVDGRVWQAVRDPLVEPFLWDALWSGDEVVWAGNASYLVRRSQGGRWSRMAYLPNHVRSIHGAARDNVWMVGDEGMILRWTGSKLQIVRDAVEDDLFGVWTDGTTAWAVGASGRILEVSDGWDILDRSTRAHVRLNAVRGRSSHDVWVVGDEGTILRRQGDERFERVRQSLTREDLTSVWSSADDTWIVGTHGAVLHWTDATQSWACDVVDTDEDLTDVWGYGPYRWAVGTSGTVFYLDTRTMH
ncbi:MAG: hypothetical protein H6729_05730 [Deltaproteobacteria bacterium]|nr:hypothetical protein [Deltaproteobacteria bacterium]